MCALSVASYGMGFYSMLVFILGTTNAQHYIDEVSTPHIPLYFQHFEDSPSQQHNARSQAARTSLNLFEVAHANI
ncbi:hypothetical protein Trydic_g9620 [Trypoxylus dichotomus]